jgi:hypothetical protein
VRASGVELRLCDASTRRDRIRLSRGCGFGGWRPSRLRRRGRPGCSWNAAPDHLDYAPGPGGGGGGEVPPAQTLPQGASVVTFPKVTGEVSPRLVNGAGDYHGPQGDPNGETDIDSYGGISGVVDRRHGMFLVGVFLTDDPPSTTAPERLDFTTHEHFHALAPEVAQTFFIGPGGGRAFQVPSGATRLFLGFADAFSGTTYYQGHPGYYDNNGGHFCVAVKVT